MDPNSSPWSYAYNRIVPSASGSGSAEEFQHPHLASITAGQSAQTLLLQAAHSGIASFNAATGGSSFVSPSPISSYNPVFQQIYHHAAAASVQPKPAHYASSAVNTPHRQIQIPSPLDKQLTSFQNQAAVAVVSSAAAAAAAANNVASNYYGENSSSSGASPSPTTVAITPTTLSWNAPMLPNTFLAMQQQHQQQTQQQQAQQHQTQQQINLVAEKVQIKQEYETTKAQVKAYGDILYLTQLQQQQQEQEDESATTVVGVESDQQLENEMYYTIDGKSYKLVRKPTQQHQVLHIEQQNASPVASYPVYASPSLSSAGDSPAAGTNMHATEATSPHVIVYKTGAGAESPISRNVAAGAGSPAAAVAAASTVAYSSVIQSTLQQQQQHQQQQHHAIHLQQQEQQQQQQHHHHHQALSNCWTKIEAPTNGEEIKNVLQLQVKQENRHLEYANDADVVSENLIFNLPPGLEIKQTFYNPETGVATSTSVLQHTQQLQQQHQQQQQQQQHQQQQQELLLSQQSNNIAAATIHHNAYNQNEKLQQQQQQQQQQQHQQQQHEKQRRQHMVANMLMSPNSQQQPRHQQQQHVNATSSAGSTTIASQIQVISKPEEAPKQKPAKTPRKRQPKKTLVTNDYTAVRSPQQEAAQQHHQQHQQAQQQTQQQHAQQQQQQQQQTSYYDFNNKWDVQLKIENNTPSPVAQTATISIPTYVNAHAAQHQQQQQQQQHQQQQPQPQSQPQPQQHQQQQQLPQPAHMQSSQAQSHPHLTNLSSYYSTFPQQIASQYNACMQQTAAAGAIQHTLYNLNQQQQQHTTNQQQQAQQQHQQLAQQQAQQQQQAAQQHHHLATQQQQQQQLQSPIPTAVVIEPTTPPVNDPSNKVIVPNIEEELEFLTNPTDIKSSLPTSNFKLSNTTNNNTNFGIRNSNEQGTSNSMLNNGAFGTENAINSYKTPEKKPLLVGTQIGAHKTKFMDSYLKFLQGDRDDIEPPMKSGRKIGYNKTSNTTVGTGAGKRGKQQYNEEIGQQQNAETDAQQTTQQQQQQQQQPQQQQQQQSPQQLHQQQPQQDDECNRIKILSQTQIVPKKRPQAQMQAAAEAAAAASTNLNSASVIQHPAEQIQQQQEPSFRPYGNQSANLHHYQQQQQQQNCSQIGADTRNHHNSSQDPLSLPPRREQSSRKAKQSSIHAIMMNSTGASGGNDDLLAEPDEFADSDTDPVWTPQEEDSDDGSRSFKRKARRTKHIPRKNNYNHQQQNVQQQQQQHPQQQQQSTIVANDGYNSNQNQSNNTTQIPTDYFKTGDFIVLRSDLINDWPTIWQVDSKCILQKYEPFLQSGKWFYKNMSKYASWNLETKKLYLKAPVRIQIQSHSETIVEFLRSELVNDDTEQFIEKIMDEYLSYRDHFEIYIQTMISQVLDPSFFSEITREKDEYFLGSVRTIDNIMDNCKRKLLAITPWTRSIIMSIETLPKCHVFTEWGQNNVTDKNCAGCQHPGVSVRFLLFGQPYNLNTMQTIAADPRVTYDKDILLCRHCAARADIFHKIAHEKYNLFINCSHRVAEQQKDYPNKTSTEVLNDLLAEHNWVDELFRNMRNSWAEVESLERQKRFNEISQ